MFSLESDGRDPGNLSELVDKMRPQIEPHVVTALVDGIPRGASVGSAAERLRTLKVKREFLHLTSDVEQQIQNPTVTPDQLLEQLEAGCTRMRDENAQAGRGVTHIGNVLREAMPVFERDWSGTGALLGTSWGFPTLDEKTSGMVALDLQRRKERPCPRELSNKASGFNKKLVAGVRFELTTFGL